MSLLTSCDNNWIDTSTLVTVTVVTIILDVTKIKSYWDK